MKLKNDIRKADDIQNSDLLSEKYMKYLKNFKEDFKVVIVLLGAFFGFKAVYDAYYDRLNLGFFHSKPKSVQREDKNSFPKEKTESPKKDKSNRATESLQELPASLFADDKVYTEIQRKILDILRKHKDMKVYELVKKVSNLKKVIDVEPHIQGIPSVEIYGDKRPYRIKLISGSDTN